MVVIHVMLELPVHTWSQGIQSGTEVTSVQGTRIVSSYVTSAEIGQGWWYSTMVPVVLYTMYCTILPSAAVVLTRGWDTWTKGPPILRTTSQLHIIIGT